MPLVLRYVNDPRVYAMRRLLWLAIFANLLLGCEPARFATGVTAYGLERYEVPPVEKVDHVELVTWKRTFIPKLTDPRVSDQPQTRMVASRITEAADVAALVGLINDNKSWTNPPLNLATAPANYYPRQDTRPVIVYWSEGVRMRELWVDGNKLVTKIGSRTVEHDMTLGEEAVVTRILRQGTAETGL